MEKIYIKRYAYNENDNLGRKEENGADKEQYRDCRKEFRISQSFRIKVKETVNRICQKTDLTAKAESVETISKEHTLIDQYKEILKREITNITNIGEEFNQLDAKYARRR